MESNRDELARQLCYNHGNISGGRIMFAPRLISLIVLAVVSFAQAQTADSKIPTGPATRPTTRPAIRQITSPEILPDHRVTIRIVAPKAADVSINGDFLQGSQKLTKDESGL